MIYAHQLLLEVGSETGIIGLAGLLVFFVIFIRKGRGLSGSPLACRREGVPPARRWDALDSTAAARYGIARADMERRGKTLAPLDMLIAAHSLEAGMILVTNDPAFSQMTGLPLEDWTA